MTSRETTRIVAGQGPRDDTENANLHDELLRTTTTTTTNSVERQMWLYDTASTAMLTTSPGRTVPRDHQNIARAVLYVWRESPGFCELQPWRRVVLGCETRGPMRLGSVGDRGYGCGTPGALHELGHRTQPHR
jgi:hypothetical protein